MLCFLAVLLCGAGPALRMTGSLVERPDHGRKLTVLYSFSGGADGGLPQAPLIRDSAGNFYGTTYYGGTSSPSSCYPYGCGVVFEIDSTGHESVLHTFVGGPTDGTNPHGGLVRDAAGNLYGTTRNGGAANYGVVFKVDPSGNETLLYSFCPNYPNCSDGGIPAAGLIADSKGHFYGTTSYGGITTGSCGGANFGCGVVFEVDAAGNETVLHAFAGAPADGRQPYANLVRDRAGHLYGTTVYGGFTTASCGGSRYGCGAAFEVSPKGTETVLHLFTDGSDGGFPVSSLLRDTTGNLYGTTQGGGAGGNGTVFKLDPAGAETTLYSFAGSPKDGVGPSAGVTPDPAGNLYGTTNAGGSAGGGVVFKLSKTGTETVLHNFSLPNGSQPDSDLLRDKFGTLYGTTEGGGAHNQGEVYSIRP